MPAKIHKEQWEVVDRLAAMDLYPDDLMEVVRYCAAAYGGCTPNDPPAARGWETWRAGVRGLRDVLLPKGKWEKSDFNGFSTVVNHAKRLQIAVAGTNEITGLIRGDLAPENRVPKGITSERAMAVNQIIEQLPLFPYLNTDSDDESEGRTEGEYQTWHLCIYINEDIVRAELARYNRYRDGYLTDCRERIFIVGEGEWSAPDIGTDEDHGPEFDFEIVRRQ
ncbi:MAG: hypothetical protein IRZ28_20270 [Steroidobacteraceae bacterium]|nr:hypothetical protein [Steroidobacteraceae bacterium]